MVTPPSIPDRIPVNIITGFLGSGKTSALNVLEDIGFTCIDNLPASLLRNLIAINSFIAPTSLRCNKINYG